MERSFHESINPALTLNVEPVTDWTDLPTFAREANILSTITSDSVVIENQMNELLDDVSIGSLSQLYLVALAIKTRQTVGSPVCLDMIQLRTKNRIYALKVCSLYFSE